MGSEIDNGKNKAAQSKRYVGRSRSSYGASNKQKAVRAPNYETSNKQKAIWVPNNDIDSNNISKQSNYLYTKSIAKWWRNTDIKRKKRIAQYKLYAVEGKVKSTFKKGFRWIKKTCSKIVNGL